MILTSNRGFAEWGEVFDDPVVASALLDRLLHQAVVVQIEGASYRLRGHADLMSATVQPFSPASPRIASLASSVQRRRRSVPSTTASRMIASIAYDVANDVS